MGRKFVVGLVVVSLLAGLAFAGVGYWRHAAEKRLQVRFEEYTKQRDEIRERHLAENDEVVKKGSADDEEAMRERHSKDWKKLEGEYPDVVRYIREKRADEAERQGRKKFDDAGKD